MNDLSKDVMSTLPIHETGSVVPGAVATFDCYSLGRCLWSRLETSCGVTPTLWPKVFEQHCRVVDAAFVWFGIVGWNAVLADARKNLLILIWVSMYDKR